MRLSDIPDLVKLAVGELPELRFNGVSCDSRRINEGDLFVAVAGNRDDGRKYIDSACARGAAGVLAEVPLRGVPVPVAQVRDARLALAVTAAAVAGHPSRKLALYGVTGTNGKTTTTWILRELLRAGGHRPGLLSTVVTEYGDRVIPSDRTTPPADQLQRLLANMVAAGCDSAVMEVSSHALDQRRTAATRFAGAIFTHLTQDHLDYHSTMESYFQAKQRLFVQLAECNPGAPAIYFPEAPFGREMGEFLSTLQLRRISCGIGAGFDVAASAVEMRTGGSTFRIAFPDGAEFPTAIGLSGRYNIDNAIGAAAMAWAAGVRAEVIADTLPGLRPRWGRLERVELGDFPATVFVDYAHTDDALRNVLKALREMNPSRLTVVFGCGGNRDRAKRPLMGKACAELADFSVVTSDNPRDESPEAIIGDILSGMAGHQNYIVEPDRRAAIRAALARAVPGEVVLVAGKGHEATQEIAGRYLPFDDRRVVMEEAAKLEQQ